MTQEDKELLLKDLCARLPYGVKVEITHWRNRDKGMIDSKIFRVPLDINKASVLIKPTSDVRPYLFPMSSMTEEQKKEQEVHFTCIKHDMSFSICRYMRWCYKNHFDINGLIEKGLALDATGLNIY